MRRRSPTRPGAAWIIVAVAVAVGSSCRQGESTPPTRPTDARAARRAVEAALAEWRDAAPSDLTTPKPRPVMFVDQQREPGRRLRAFAILSESEMDGCRRFRVRLAMADPDETILAAYYVFGRGPIWVYRAEDFDMIMHMDKSMMARAAADPPAAAGTDRASGPGQADRDAAEGRFEIRH